MKSFTISVKMTSYPLHPFHRGGSVEVVDLFVFNKTRIGLKEEL